MLPPAMRSRSGATTGLAATGGSTGANTAPYLQPPDLANCGERYGARTTFVDFRARLRCRYCGSDDVSTIVDGHHETPGERWARDSQ
jgi:hypothetical protein